MRTLRVGLIGIGTMGGFLVDSIVRGEVGAVQLVGICDVVAVAPHLQELAEKAGCPWTHDALDLLQWQPDIVVEAASQQAVREYAVPLAECGINLLLMSVGALADEDLYERLTTAAKRSGSTLRLPSGAIGGLDALMSARVAGLDEVSLVTSKPPNALAGAPFFDEHPIDLEGVKTRTIIFEGCATDAARLFPSNVNVAVAVGLAGVGPRKTRMVVVADPALSRNVHQVTARGAFGELCVELSNLPSPSNPRTSYLAMLSLLNAVRQTTEPVRFG
jgi:aspartate dehydrogenase